MDLQDANPAFLKLSVALIRVRVRMACLELAAVVCITRCHHPLTRATFPLAEFLQHHRSASDADDEEGNEDVGNVLSVSISCRGRLVDIDCDTVRRGRRFQLSQFAVCIHSESSLCQGLTGVIVKCYQKKSRAGESTQSANSTVVRLNCFEFMVSIAKHDVMCVS